MTNQKKPVDAKSSNDPATKTKPESETTTATKSNDRATATEIETEEGSTSKQEVAISSKPIKAVRKSGAPTPPELRDTSTSNAEGLDDSDVLANGEMTIEGRMPWSSNATFLVQLTLGDQQTKAIYKPHRGERPLWDFASGLYQREVAMYELSAFLGWDVIPRTVRRGGEFGIGSVQQFVEADFEQHYFTIAPDRPTTLPSLRALTVLDIIANNADRKSGHVLIDEAEHIWGIDNGLCFHEEFKLRTVMWDYAGDRIPKLLQPDVERLANAKPGSLGLLDELLSPSEMEVMLDRTQRLLRKPVFPAPHSDYAYPWPMV